MPADPELRHVTDPSVVMLHTVRASHAHDAAAEHAAIESRLGIEIPMARTPAESAELIADAEIVFAGGLTTELLEAATRLEWIQAFSSGVDFYPLERIREEGIVLTNAAGISADPIAEQILGYMLTFSRRLHRGHRQQADRRWERYEGRELNGSTLGIVGVGAIGSRLAELADALGMEVLGVTPRPEVVPDAVSTAVAPDRLHDVLAEVDYLALCCPLTPETRGLIGGPEIETMGRDAVLINVARGGVVDYDRLEPALANREIAGAALDVFPEEPYDPEGMLWGLSNVVVTPHMAGSTDRKPERIADLIARNYEAHLAGEAMPTRVDDRR